VLIASILSQLREWNEMKKKAAIGMFLVVATFALLIHINYAEYTPIQKMEPVWSVVEGQQYVTRSGRSVFVQFTAPSDEATSVEFAWEFSYQYKAPVQFSLSGLWKAEDVTGLEYTVTMMIVTPENESYVLYRRQDIVKDYAVIFTVDSMDPFLITSILGEFKNLANFLLNQTGEYQLRLVMHFNPQTIGATAELTFEDATFTLFGIPPPPSEVQVGVKTGDWIKINYTISVNYTMTGILPEQLPSWTKVEFLSVEGTNATVQVAMHMSDGTVYNETRTFDIYSGGMPDVTGTGGFVNFVIPANRKAGDSVYMLHYGNFTFTGETTRTYAGVNRTLVYASFDELHSYYWDKETGILVEASTTSRSMNGTAIAVETNMWQASNPTPLWMPWWFYAIVAIVIVALVGAIYLKKRRPTTPTTPSQSVE